MEGKRSGNSLGKEMNRLVRRRLQNLLAIRLPPCYSMEGEMQSINDTEWQISSVMSIRNILTKDK